MPTSTRSSTPPRSTPQDLGAWWHWHVNASNAGAPVHVYGTRLDASTAGSRRNRRAAQSRAAQLLARQMLQDRFPSYEKHSWQLSRLATGRPIVRGHGAPNMSVSHSGEWVVCAMGHVEKLGIDIERACGRDWVAAAALALHADEIRWVMAAGTDEHETRALRCWTSKEAMIKAMDAAHWAWQMPRLAFNADGHPTIIPAEWGPAESWSACSRHVDGDATVSVVWQ